MQVIIFQQDDNKVAIMYPAPEYVDQLEAIAQKDVPVGRAYRIVDPINLPPYDMQHLWRWTDSGPLDVVEETPIVPDSISFAQLIIGLVTEQWISRQEGEAWLQGILPSQVQSLINTLPENQQFFAIARATRPSVIMRNDPLVDTLATLQQKTPEEIDQFFITYSGV
jgi:hypothetical protein